MLIISELFRSIMIIHSRYDAGMSKRDEYGSLSLRKLKTRRHYTPTLIKKPLMNIFIRGYYFTKTVYYGDYRLYLLII